jgi:hypothetical protein
MYYNIRNSSITQETKANTFHLSEMSADLSVPEPVGDGPPLGSASPEGAVAQKAVGSEISPRLALAWVAAQWTWASDKNTRLRVAMTFMTPQDIEQRAQPRRITFYLTDRMREFRATNELQQQVLTLALLRQQQWIGKARIRQRAGQAVQDHHRRNIPDVAMTAQVIDTGPDQAHVEAMLYTPNQQIALVFDQPLTTAQRRYYLGAATWGCRPAPRDDFHDWMNYA